MTMALGKESPATHTDIDTRNYMHRNFIHKWVSKDVLTDGWQRRFFNFVIILILLNVFIFSAVYCAINVGTFITHFRYLLGKEKHKKRKKITKIKIKLTLSSAYRWATGLPLPQGGK
jgi:hypothetical protein